jgi:predicted lipoprotein with Yx(FWY)xxD motif
MRRLTAGTVALLLAIGAIASVAAIATSAVSTPATVKTRSTSLGTILVDAKGRTLYLFMKDKNAKSACAGACATAWPPLLTKGQPKAAGHASTSKLGTTKRSDGTTQVTYNRHPLYRFIQDKNTPGSVKGEGLKAFGAEWYVVGSGGSKIEKKGTKTGY